MIFLILLIPLYCVPIQVNLKEKNIRGNEVFVVEKPGSLEPVRLDKSCPKESIITGITLQNQGLDRNSILPKPIRYTSVRCGKAVKNAD